MNGFQATDEATIAKQLVARILENDKLAESELVHRYNQGLITVLRNESKDESLAKDIAQESWEHLLPNIRNNKVKNPEKLGAYIIQTGKYRLLMYFRKQGKRRYESDEQLETVIDQNDSPEKAYSRVQQGQKIEEVLSALKERDALILRETYIKGAEKSRLCSILELSSAHFDRVLYRARQRYQKIWLEKYGDKD